MNNYTYKSEFNARWISPEKVAKYFVPTSEFRKLVHSTHSILLGPRGCGKTTLLKMLTRQALDFWDENRKSSFDRNPFDYPEFETLYFPSDVRWSYELKALRKETLLNDEQIMQIQRIMTTLGILKETLKTSKYIINGSIEEEVSICKIFIDLLQLKDTIPTLFDIETTISNTVTSIRGALNMRNTTILNSLINNLSPSFYGHIIDIPAMFCSVMKQVLKHKIKYETWALCFDELEIAPSWLREELFESIRSVDQDIILKLTYTPLLPSGIRTVPESQEDYKPIRLWYSHVGDSTAFCENLAKSFLKYEFDKSDIKPADVFSNSNLASEDDSVYGRSSAIYEQMKSLAKDDMIFKLLLQEHGVNPTDPYTDNIGLRDSFLRKIKPIVILRKTFVEGTKRRSRKIVTAYAGIQAIYAMSEGNPRHLLGLLTDIIEKWKIKPEYDKKGLPKVSYLVQRKILNISARHFGSFLRSVPLGASHDQTKVNLIDFIEHLGKNFKNEIYGSSFPVDPFGSFNVDKNVGELYIPIIEKGIELGAIIYVGESQEDLPRKIRDERFRLSFMLSPIYRLSFRNYRANNLSSLLSKKFVATQTYLFDEENNKQL